MNRIRKSFALLLCVCLLLAFASCSTEQKTSEDVPTWGDLKYKGTLPLQYADQFAIYQYEGGYSLIDMNNSERILVVPEGGDVPDGIDSDVVVIRQPLEKIYLAATSAMALFEGLDAIDSISWVGSKYWYTEKAAQALENGVFTYAGKYNAPDYEMLVGAGCQLAIESTMILHNPEVKEKLTELGINTIVERSSYEEHPLGRTEWIKVYGALLGKEAEAEALFNAEAEKIKALESLESTGKTAAFFYVNTSGNVVTYKSEGYVPAMIRIAGGEYLPSDLGLEDSSKLSTINMNMEQFYDSVKDADVFIYNCSIASQLNTLSDFLALSPVLEDCRAVREKNVWCTTESMFQQTDKMGTIIGEMNKIFTGEAESEELRYIFKLQ